MSNLVSPWPPSEVSITVMIYILTACLRLVEKKCRQFEENDSIFWKMIPLENIVSYHSFPFTSTCPKCLNGLKQHNIISSLICLPKSEEENIQCNPKWIYTLWRLWMQLGIILFRNVLLVTSSDFKVNAAIKLPSSPSKRQLPKHLHYITNIHQDSTFQVGDCFVFKLVSSKFYSEPVFFLIPDWAPLPLIQKAWFF